MVANQIKKHQQIKEADIIPLERRCHAMSELFSESGFVDPSKKFLPHKDDPPQTRLLEELNE